MVAISNPAHVEQLLRTATDFARARNGELLLVSVIHKYASSPFLLFSGESIAREFDDGKRALLDRASSMVEDVPVRRKLLVSDNVADALLEAAVEADAMLLGWQEQTRPSDAVLGTTVDPVISRAPCDVYIEREGNTADGVHSILLPTVGVERAKPAARLANAIATANGATVSVVAFVDPDADAEIRRTREKAVDDTAALLSARVETAVESRADSAAAITDAAADHDLVILGSTRERTIRTRVVGSVARSVSRDADPPVIIANRGVERPLLSRIGSLLGRSAPPKSP